MKKLFFLLPVSLLAISCSGMTLDTHTPNVTDQDAAYELDAGTDPNDMICSAEQKADGDCG